MPFNPTGKKATTYSKDSRRVYRGRPRKVQSIRLPGDSPIHGPKVGLKRGGFGATNEVAWADSVFTRACFHRCDAAVGNRRQVHRAHRRRGPVALRSRCSEVARLRGRRRKAEELGDDGFGGAQHRGDPVYVRDRGRRMPASALLEVARDPHCLPASATLGAKPEGIWLPGDRY